MRFSDIQFPMATELRPIKQIIRPEPTVEGAGVHLVRTIGTRQLTNLDPFLLLDHFESSVPADYRAGFPFHPHRGIETVTILRAGQVRHGDSLGHKGTIEGGGIQWMTSGSGILHEEMPVVQPGGISGLQLWLNLPAREKMTRPKYRDLRADQLATRITDDGAKLRVIAGEADDGRVQGPVVGLSVAPKFIDVTLPHGSIFREQVPAGHTAFAYVDRGEVSFGADDALRPVAGPALVVFGDGDMVRAKGSAKSGGRFLLAAARPIGEPIARYGPFVMNTPKEIEETLDELRTGRFIREEASGS
jgi:redox-sensitive bicupin YhaK (pirin superfamily)